MANSGPPADGEEIIRASNAPAPDKNDPENAASETKKKLHWLEIGYFSSQIGLAAIGIVALWIYHGQLTAMQGQLDQMGKQSAEMQKQTTVLRQQMVGTQAAALVPVFQFVPTGQFIINVDNDGLVSASGVHIHGQAQRLRLTDGKRYGDPFPFEEKFPIIAPKGRQAPSWFLPWHPRELMDNKEWPAGWPGRESFTFEGEIRYQNGFGDEIRDTFCQKYIPRYFIQFKSGGLSMGGGGALESCRNFDQRVRSILAAEKQAENGADRPDPPL
jgi:uncharacterized membrane protein YgcG